MPSRVLTVTPTDPRAERVERVADILRGGGVVALPTETFYGLAADAGNAEAVLNVNRLKRKSADSPTLLLLADYEQATGVASRLPEAFADLAEKFWPGPLTMVVPAAAEVPEPVTGGRGTVGVRVPGLALPRRIAAALGRPITGVSANLNGETPARTAMEVARTFPDGVDLILDGGPAPGGAPSTVLDLTGERLRVLREGAVTIDSLNRLAREPVER